MNGRNVLHAMGYDAFGLPAEQYAVEHGRHPRATTDANIATRIKMGQTSNVYAVVKADNKFYTASKEVKVTLGGCGG